MIEERHEHIAVENKKLKKGQVVLKSTVADLEQEIIQIRYNTNVARFSSPES